MKHIGFLSFGHWTPSPKSQTRSASDALLQSIELSVAAEELGADGAYFRVPSLRPPARLARGGARTFQCIDTVDRAARCGLGSFRFRKSG